MKISALVPTYKRPIDLNRCLQAFSEQSEPAGEIIVVVRNDDSESFEVANKWSGALNIKIVAVDEPGVVQAMNKGLSFVNGEFVVITDDDAAPHVNWTLQIRRAFEQSDLVAGVGGRDIIKNHEETEPIGNVGKVTWYGKLIGNHHRGKGKARGVDVLKGVNCAYRSSVLKSIGFDKNLLGNGAQVHWELSLGMQLRKSGFKLIYDPNILVDHYVSIRHDEDKRDGFNEVPFYNSIFNETLSIYPNIAGLRRFIFVIWMFVVGHRAAPGFMQLIRLKYILCDKNAGRKFRICAHARYDGLTFCFKI